MARIDEILDNLNVAGVFYTLNVISGCFEIEMTEKSKPPHPSLLTEAIMDLMKC